MEPYGQTDIMRHRNIWGKYTQSHLTSKEGEKDVAMERAWCGEVVSFRHILRMVGQHLQISFEMCQVFFLISLAIPIYIVSFSAWSGNICRLCPGGGFCQSHDCSTTSPRVPQKSHAKYKVWKSEIVYFLRGVM